MASQYMHGEDLFANAQEARALLQDFGFSSLVRIGAGEHFVRGSRRCTLIYGSGTDDDRPALVPLDGCQHVWFARRDRYGIIPTFE